MTWWWLAAGVLGAGIVGVGVYSVTRVRALWRHILELRRLVSEHAARTAAELDELEHREQLQRARDARRRHLRRIGPLP